jgi:hypothetical protein
MWEVSALLGWLVVLVVLAIAARSRSDRFWRTRGGVAANVIVGLLLVILAVASAVDGLWLYALGDVLIVIVFGVRPALQAHRDGVLYLTMHR